MGSEWSSESLLFFHNLVIDEQLSACVLSVSDHVCNVKLESKGQDVAAALISEQLARATGVITNETRAATNSDVKCEEKVNDNKLSQPQEPGLNHTGPKEIPSERAATPAEGQMGGRCPEDEQLGGLRNGMEMLLSCFRRVFPTGLEDGEAASQPDLPAVHPSGRQSFPLLHACSQPRSDPRVHVCPEKIQWGQLQTFCKWFLSSQRTRRSFRV